MQVFPKKVFRSVPRNPMGIACSEGPLALGPRSSGTNFQSAPDGLISKSTGTADVPFTS